MVPADSAVPALAGAPTSATVLASAVTHQSRRKVLPAVTLAQPISTQPSSRPALPVTGPGTVIQATPLT